MLPKYRIQSVPRGQTPLPLSSCRRKLASFSLHWSRSCSHRSELAVECWQHFGDQQLERGQVWLVPFALEQIPRSLVKLERQDTQCRIDLLHRKQLWIIMLSHPRTQLPMLRMTPIPQRLKQMSISPNTTAI